MAPLGVSWATFGAVLGHLVAAWPPLGPRGSKRDAQEQPKRVQKSTGQAKRAAQERPNKAKKAQERPQDPRERPKKLPREVPKTPKEFEGVPESTQDKLRKHRESKSTRKQPNTAPPKNLLASSGLGGGREALKIT